MPPVKFVPNPHGIAAIGYSAEMQAVMQEKADKAANVARELALPHVRSGEYRASIHADSGTTSGRARTTGGQFRATSGGRLAIGRVVADTPYAVFVEFGTSVMEAQAILRRATEQAWSGL
jgi:HK97 gp10 family phage protein